MKRLLSLVVVLVAASLIPLLSTAADQYEVGGPLAGVKLPLAPTEHGAPPGHPGCIPELAAKAKAEIMADPEKAKDFNELNAPFTPVGQYPELELYPGSVEHWRAYMFKYMPVRALFDRQTQLKNWVAPELPGATAAQAGEYAEPIWWVPRWGHHVETGYNAKPVPVVRLGLGDAPLTLDCGKLPAGVYVLRTIAAVPRAQIDFFRRDLFLQLTVNDKLDGGTTTYTCRTPYTDQLYSVSELFFHVPAERQVKATLQVAEGSQVALLIHNITLDDVLAGHEQRAIKQKATLLPGRGEMAIANTSADSDLPKEERWARDAWLWQSFPRDNAQASRPYRFPGSVKNSVPDVDAKAFAAEQGTWHHQLYSRSNGTFSGTPENPGIFLVNKKLGLTYSFDDYANHRPLPDPYPVKDNGAGVTWANPNDPTDGHWFCPIADQVHELFWYYPEVMHQSVAAWEKKGNERYARDAAIALARWAYAFPTLVSQDAYFDNGIAEYGSVGRDGRFRRRLTTSRFYRWYTMYATQELDDYDILFPYIKANPDIAASIGRFVPWVKTPDDVIKLIDVYLVQNTAKRVLRYNWHTGEMKISRLATVLGDNQLTDPWMDWLFSRTFVYPLPIAGLPDLMITGTTREGTEYVASSYYAGGENAIPKAADLIDYLRAGGNPKYDLSNPQRYPKPLAACDWLVERHVAGLNHIRIGDVTGPDKFYGGVWSGLENASYWGWKWGKDPRFAYILTNYFKRTDQSDEEWAAIEQAATKIQRPPWLDQPSRALPQWATILESGRQHDDHRFRRTVALRTGMGWGHHHDDALDLQIWEHGTMMTCDGGQRPSYSKPADRSTRMHNVVEVDGLSEQGGEWLGHSWTRSLVDREGAKYALCEAAPPYDFPQVSLYERQTALIDVDEGQGSQPLTAAQARPDAELPANVVTPNSYVFDVVRVAGGSLHSYNFHANLSDEVTHNLGDAKPVEELPAPEQEYLRKMAGERLGGTAPEHLQVTWQIAEKQVRADLKKNFNPASGPWFTRLHLIGEAGDRVLRGSLDCVKWKYQIPMAFVQRHAPAGQTNLQSAFAVIIEPYAQTPYIESIERLSVPGNDDSARQAVALAVTTTNGHRDLCFADATAGATRQVDGATICGEFAHLSRAGGQLQRAVLAGGSLLQANDVVIKPAAAAYTATIKAVDYQQKTMTLDQSWPAIDARSQVFTFEVGVDDHQATYTATAVKGNQVTVQRGADYYRAAVKEVDAATNTVMCALSFGSGREGIEPSAGIDKHWVASNDDATTFWRAEYLGGDRATARFNFKLDGKAATMADFGENGVFRLWEYGPGDTVRHTTSVSLSRRGDGSWLLESDVDVEVKLPGTAAEFTGGGNAATASSDGKWVTIRFTVAKAPAGKTIFQTK